MAHRFDNFDDAFEEWSGYFASLKTLYATAGSQLFAAYDGCPDPVDRYHFYQMYAAIQTMRNMFVTLTNLTSATWDRSSLFESMYWGNKDVAAADVTMGAMTSAMITATDDEYKYFIGLIDAFRVGLWNKPFNAEYFAALARGFEGGF